MIPSGLLFRPNSLTIGFQASSDETWVEKEKLIYPLSSLVAEFGGTLGLFIGFSFIGVWDQLGFIPHICHGRADDVRVNFFWLV